MRRFPLSVVLCLCATGCADMLGLNGLTYEQEPSPEPVAGAGGSEPIVGGTGGGGGDIAVGQCEKDAAVPVSSEALVVLNSMSDLRNRLWIYEPAEGELSSYFNGDCGLQKLASRFWVAPLGQSWTNMVVVPTDSGPMLVAYERGQGQIDRATEVSPDSELEIEHSVGTAHLSELLAVSRQGEWQLLTYTAESGVYRWLSVHRDATAPTGNGRMGENWTSLSAYHFDGHDGVLKFDQERQRIEFDAFPSESGPLEPVLQMDLPEEHREREWIPLPDAGSGLVLSYDSDLGQANLYGPRLLDENWFWDGATSEVWSYAQETNTLPGGVTLRVLPSYEPTLVANNGSLVWAFEVSRANVLVVR